MKEREGADERRGGLEEFPYEGLGSIKADRQLKTALDKGLIVAQEVVQVHGGEDRHRRALIELDRVAQNAVAEVVTPRQMRRRAVGEVVHARQIAADPAN